MVEYFKSLTDVTVGCELIFHQMLQNLSTLLIWTFYWKKFDRQDRSAKEQNKEVQADTVKCSAKQSVVVASFQRTSPEDWGFSNKNNHFSKMTTFEQWNYGDVQRGVLIYIKKDIISYEKVARLSFDYAFAHHKQARLLCNDLISKTIYFFWEISTVVEDLYHRLFLKCVGSQSSNKEAVGYVMEYCDNSTSVPI